MTLRFRGEAQRLLDQVAITSFPLGKIEVEAVVLSIQFRGKHGNGLLADGKGRKSDQGSRIQAVLPAGR